MKRLFVHIGTHKTGTKSIQSFLESAQSQLVERGCRFYLGLQGNRTCHGELGLAALRGDRDSFARRRFPAARGAAYVERVRRHVAEYLQRVPEEAVIFSNEDLSYLRFADELATLSDVLGRQHLVTIVVFLRQRCDFLRSYRQQILSVPGRQVSDDTRSAFYVEPDSWLTDYDALLNAYGQEFGHENIRALDYDVTVSSDGNVLPAFLRAIEQPDIAPHNLEPFFIHRSPVI